jgi:ADP-ribosylglycohydrolase
MNDTRKTPILIGAIAGDVIGSIYERRNIKTTDFELFSVFSRYTDDTVLTIALADSILNKKPVVNTLYEYGNNYKNVGYGSTFRNWLQQAELKPYNSWGNGSAMRVSPVGFAYHSEKDVLEKAKESAEVTHNHPEGIKGAQATAISIFLARTGSSKDEIREYVSKNFGYDLSRNLDDIRPGYRFDVSCQGSVPEAIIAFLSSHDYESTIRLAISIGGDSDTIACIAGGIAQAFYKEIPEYIVNKTLEKLPREFVDTIEAFDKRFIW